MDTGGSGNDVGMGDGSGIAVLNEGLNFALSSLGLSVSALVDPVRPLSDFRGVEAARDAAGVDRARCSWFGRDRGLVESSMACPEVSIVRLRLRRLSCSRALLAVSLVGDIGDSGRSERPRTLRGRLWVSPEKRRVADSLSMADTGTEELEPSGEGKMGKEGRCRRPLGTSEA